MIEELKDLGLSENEIDVYLTLLKTGPLTSYSLAEKTSLNRGYLYELAKKLHEKGIISEVNMDGKKYYQATTPDQLSALLEFKLENLKKISSSLKQIENIWKEKTHIDVFKGKLCYKILLKDMITSLKKSSTSFIFGIDEQLLMDIEPLYLQRYLTLIKRKQIQEKVIVRQGTKPLQDAKGVAYKYLPKKMIGKIVQFIYEDKVALLTLSEPLYLVIIQDKDIAETYKLQFDVFWSIAR